MEDSFNARVNKVFGALPSPATASVPSSSLWCLTDEEIEKREWNRNKGSPVNDDEPRPYPKNLDGFVSNQGTGGSEIKTSDLLQELDEEFDDDEDEDVKELTSRKLQKADDIDEEAWSIRSLIGQDCTVDNEEEEDEFDQVAIGSEKAVKSLYRRDITEYMADRELYNKLPIKLRDANKDPRATRRAAKIQLQEDAEVAGNIDHSFLTPYPAPNTKNDISKESVNPNSINPNSILKNKASHIDTKSKKRVRFESSCKDENSSEGSEIQASKETSLGEDRPASLPKEDSNVPDYVRNPSKYKHYTFDPSPEIDDASNQRAYADFLKLVKQSDQMDSQDTHPFELPKSVVFTPKKKIGESTVATNRIESEQNQKKHLPIAMAAEDEHESDEVCAMEEDENEHDQAVNDRIKISQKAGRRYRIKNSE